MKRWTADSGVSRVKVSGTAATAWAAVIALVITGCAEVASSPPSAGGSGTARATAVSSPGGPLAAGKSGPGKPARPFKVTQPDGSTLYTGVGAEVWPAPAGAHPTVSRQQVIAALESGHKAPDPQGPGRMQPSSVTLVEYENVFGARNHEGTETPSVPKQLAWFAEYDNLTRHISVPIGLATRLGPSAGVSSGWTAIVVISATTGQVLDAFDYSGM